MSELTPVPSERIDRSILIVRGQKIFLDRDLAFFYGVETRVLNQAVKRHAERFPSDFMFELSREEIRNLSQFVTSPTMKHSPKAYAFTEQGVAMLSGLLNSPRAIAVNIEIMRSFVRLRQMISTNADLSRKLAALENKYDKQFKIIFDAIRELMSPDKPPHNRQIGFHTTLKLTPKKT